MLICDGVAIDDANFSRAAERNHAALLESRQGTAHGFDRKRQIIGDVIACYGKIIDRKAQLEPLNAGLTRTSGADAGIVDQDIEPTHRRLHRAGKSMHLLER